MNIATLPNTVTAAPLASVIGFTDADIMRADRELAYAFESMFAHWQASGDATEAEESLEEPEALDRRPDDFALGIPGAKHFCSHCQQGSALGRYVEADIETMRTAARYRKKSDAPRIARMREIIQAYDTFRKDKARLGAAEERAAGNAYEASRRLERLIDKIANSTFSTPEGFALQALALLAATEEGLGDGCDDCMDALEKDAHEWAAYKALTRHVKALFPQFHTTRVFYRNSKQCRLHPTFD